MSLNQKKLEKLMETAGLDEATKEKMRAANTDEESPRPRGHGPSEPAMVTVEEL